MSNLKWTISSLVKNMKIGRAWGVGLVSLSLSALPAQALSEEATILGERPANDPEVAAAEEPIMPKRLYLGASLGVSRLDPLVDDTPFVIEDRTDLALSLLGGFHITPRIMAQFSYSDAGSAELEHSITGERFDLDYSIWSADLQYYLWQHDNGVALFAGVGATYIDNDAQVEVDKKDDMQLKVKGGLDYALSSDVWLRAQYESFSGDAQILSLGALKYFGGAKRVTEIVTEVCETASLCGEEPYLDDDADGVINRLDKCPSTLPGLKVDEEGCAMFNRTYSNVLFKFNSWELTDIAVEILDEMAIELNKVPFVHISISAHTDYIGTIAYNNWLSQKRARSILHYLIDKGVDDLRMEARGYGELEPIANNNSPEGRQLNRRAEFKIVRNRELEADETLE